MSSLKTEVQKCRFELDKLEQYSCKESMRLYGVVEKDDEVTSKVVAKVCNDLGVQVREEDISVSHRLPYRRFVDGQPKSKPIIAKFVRRDTKTEVMKKKKNLKGMPAYSDVFIADDLTPLRSKMLCELKKDDQVKRAWSIDGRISCIVLENGNDVRKYVDSPDDLFKVGWSEEKMKESGFFDF